MPLGDRTGPRGLGPKTGRGLGYGSGFNTPGYITGGSGGFGFGLGRRRGYGGYSLPGWMNQVRREGLDRFRGSRRGFRI